MKVVIIHHDDADGRCAAAIIGRDSLSRGADMLAFFSVNYGDPVPDLSAFTLSGLDEVWIVDFSFSPEQMLELRRSLPPRFFWFDHHKTNMCDELQFLPGSREDGTAACMLVWRFCHAGEPAPWAVEFIADRDVWTFYHGDNTRYFYEIYLMNDTRPESNIWDSWFSLDFDQLKDLLHMGGLLYGARINNLVAMAKRLGREIDLRAMTFGKLSGRVLQVNFPGSGDMGQAIQDLGYDVAWCWVEFERNNRPVRTHSVYSSKVDVSEIAKFHGGGGHAGAAGWEEYQPWGLAGQYCAS